MCDADVPSSCLILEFFRVFVCILLFLNICNTVMMTSCHVEMSAVLFLYVCVQASKEIIKLKIRCVCIHFFLMSQAKATRAPLSSHFSLKRLVWETPPSPPHCSLSLPLSLPVFQAGPNPDAHSLFLSFIWPHPFTAGIKEPSALWVGSV